MFDRIETSSAFERVFPILQEAFPVTELRTKQKQKELLQDPLYRLYAIQNETLEDVGVLAFWELGQDWIYMEHFAISPEKRNGGFGGFVLDSFLNQIQKNAVLEVEVPEDTLTKRRVAFYERHGFYFNPYPYLQPPMREGQSTLPLRLMTRPTKIDVDTYERYRLCIHQKVYRFFQEEVGRVNKKEWTNYTNCL